MCPFEVMYIVYDDMTRYNNDLCFVLSFDQTIKNDNHVKGLIWKAINLGAPTLKTGT